MTHDGMHLQDLMSQQQAEGSSVTVRVSIDSASLNRRRPAAGGVCLSVKSAPTICDVTKGRTM